MRFALGLSPSGTPSNEGLLKPSTTVLNSGSIMPEDCNREVRAYVERSITEA